MEKDFFNGLKNNIFVFEETESTNTLAREFAENGCADGVSIIAKRQVNGVGRLGRSFFSPDGGVYLSYVINLTGEEKNFSLLTLFAGLAAARAVEKCAEISCRIKWCNDIYCEGKKLGGILTLGVNSDSGRLKAAVIGIGLNVLAKGDDFPQDIRNRAASVFSLTGRTLPPEMLAAEVIGELNTLLLDKKLLTADCEGELSEIRSRSCTIGQEVSVLHPSGDKTVGTAIGISDSGALLVKTAEEKEPIALMSGTLM